MGCKSKSIDDIIDQLLTLRSYDTQNRRSFSLVAKVLSAEPLIHESIKSTLTKVWGIKNNVTVNELGENLLAFVFEDKAEYDKVFNLSPWAFKNHLVIVQPWPAERALVELEFDKVEFWVQVHGLPILLATEELAKRIGNTLGKFIKSDLDSETDLWRNVFRIRVELDITNPLKDSISLEYRCNKLFCAKLRYEKLPEFCHSCGLLGHNLKSCTPSEDVLDYAQSYGDHMRATSCYPFCHEIAQEEPAEYPTSQTSFNRPEPYQGFMMPEASPEEIKTYTYFGSCEVPTSIEEGGPKIIYEENKSTDRESYGERNVVKWVKYKADALRKQRFLHPDFQYYLDTEPGPEIVVPTLNGWPVLDIQGWPYPLEMSMRQLNLISSMHGNKRKQGKNKKVDGHPEV